MKPVVDRLEKDYAGKVDVKRMPTDTGDPEVARLATLFKIQYVPTFVFVDASGVQKDLLIGQVDEATLRQKLDALR